VFAPEYESCGVSRRVMLSLRSISLVRCAILRRLRMTRGGALSVISPLPLRLRVKKNPVKSLRDRALLLLPGRERSAGASQQKQRRRGVARFRHRGRLPRESPRRR